MSESKPSARKIMAGSALLVGALVLWFWLGGNEEPEAGSGAKPSDVQNLRTRSDAAAAGPAQALPPRVKENVLAHQELAGLYGTQMAVLNCRLAGELRPAKDLFVQFPNCEPSFSYPYDYVDGWFTSIVRQPAGRGGICDDFDPADLGKLAPMIQTSPLPDRFLSWQGAGTSEASCRFVELAMANVVGTFEHPAKTVDGIDVRSVITSNCGRTTHSGLGPEFRLTVEFEMSEKSVVCPILAGIWFDDADGQYQEFLVDEVEVVLDPLKDQLVQFQISQEELGEFRARNQPVGKVTGVGLLTRDTKPLREGLDADSRAMPLLRRMQKIRDLRELALDEGAWDNYQKTRASWMKQQLKFGTVSEDQVEEAFDEWWQDTLDGLEESSPTAIDALGRPVHDNGAP